MKFKIIPFIFALGAVGAFLYFSNASKTEVTPEKNEVPVSTLPDGKYCYQYSQKATNEAPFSVEEYTEIVLNGNEVSGLKRGSQSGPDMSNGYDGTFTGTRTEDNLSIRFKYVIEGSKGEEMELYSISENTLVKHRYTLKDESGVLVPNMDEFVKDIVATKVSCRE